MYSRRTKAIIIVSIIVFAMFGALVYAQIHSKSTTTNKRILPTLPDSHPPQEVLTVVSRYVQAHENAVGADQSSPTAWLSIVQPITSPAWFAKLQPPSDTATGSALAEYNIAHTQGLAVKAFVEACIWNFKYSLPTPTAGDIYCQLSDETINYPTGAEVTAADLPFGWSHSGPQSPVTLKVIKINGVWLINDDTSGAD